MIKLKKEKYVKNTYNGRKTMNLKEKVFVVTGGGNGIGREIVLNLLRNGAYVAALDLDVKGLNETKKLSEDHENLKTYELNITNLEAVEKMSETVLKDFGRVDGLINVAGIIQPFVSVKELDYGAIERVMNVNFYGTLYMVKSFLPFLLKDEPTRIVNVSSMGGLTSPWSRYLWRIKGCSQIND